MPGLNNFGSIEEAKVNFALRDACYCLDKALTEALSNYNKFQARINQYFSNGAVGTSAANHLIMFAKSADSRWSDTINYLNQN